MGLSPKGGLFTKGGTPARDFGRLPESFRIVGQAQVFTYYTFLNVGLAPKGAGKTGHLFLGSTSFNLALGPNFSRSVNGITPQALAPYISTHGWPQANLAPDSTRATRATEVSPTGQPNHKAGRFFHSPFFTAAYRKDLAAPAFTYPRKGLLDTGTQLAATLNSLDFHAGRVY